jgi:hypothetical protein
MEEAPLPTFISSSMEDYIEFIKLGNTIKENLVRETKRETSAFMLRCLRAILNEQV